CGLRFWYAVGLLSLLFGHDACYAEEQLDEITQMAICEDAGNHWKNGQCILVPPRVEIIGGNFRMGCEATRDALGKACDPTELPAHTVTLAPFWIGTHEVTFAQWDACTTCFKIEDKGKGRGNRPVSGVSWLDVQVYLTWLKTVTGDTSYRLPTEAEWEFSARAGKDSAYPWGQSATCKDASYGRVSCNLNTTVEVGSYQPNAWGLFDTSGNVWEWVADCGHGNYQGFPGNGAAWLEGCDNSDLGVLRGGSYVLDAHKIRTASRVQSQKTNRQFTHGFRIAKGVSSP
ncbi:MAG: formylglycine-generating enzyme family protein, partial [Minisyncoccales bacterium]